MKSTAKAVQVKGGALFCAGQSVAERTTQFQDAQGTPLSEVIRWLVPLNDRVVLLKDGSLMACMDFAGRDVDSGTDDELATVRKQLQYCLEQFQDQAPTISWQVRRRITTLYPQGQYPDPISERMNQLQHDRFIEEVHYINRHTLTLSMPPSAASTRLLQAMARAQGQGLIKVASLWLSSITKSLKGEVDFPYGNVEEVEQALFDFEKSLSTFLASISSLRPRLLSGEALAGFLELSCTPTSDLYGSTGLGPHGLSLLDETLPQGDINNELADVIEFSHNGRKACASAFSLDLRKREKLGMDLFDSLMSAPFEFTLSQVFKALPRQKAVRAIGEAHTYHANRKYGIKSILVAAASHGKLDGVPVNTNREDDANEALAVKNSIEAGKEGAGLYYGVLMVQAPTAQQLDKNLKQAEEILHGARLNPRLEGLHKFSSFCACIPGSHEEVARWVKITSENFVDLCPVRTIDSGHLVNEYLSDSSGQTCHALVAFPTRAKTPYYYSGYVGQVGHELVIGPTGTGKTVISTVCWSQFRKYPGARVLIFDKNWSCRPAVYLQGGNYIDLNPERQEGRERKLMSPIAALMAGGSQRHLPFLVRWCELVAGMRGYQVSATDHKDLERALRSTAELGQTEPSALRLGTVVVKLDSTTELAKQLSLWVGESANASYYDNERDDLDLDRLTGIEMGTILNNDELAAPFMSYAFYRIEVRLRDMGAREDAPVPMQIYIPEAWYFVRHPVFSKELDEWLVTLRKLGARITMDTQNPDKLVQSPAFAAIRDNIPSLILTPNAKASTTSLKRMYLEELGLSEQDLEFIRRGVPGQDYYIRSGEMARRISMRLGPELVAMVRSDPKAQKALDHYIQQGLPPGWQQDYLQELIHE